MILLTNCPIFFPHVDAWLWFTHSDEVVATNAMRNSTLQGACPHVGLFASKLGAKASTNLGAPQTANFEQLQ